MGDFYWRPQPTLFSPGAMEYFREALRGIIVSEEEGIRQAVEEIVGAVRYLSRVCPPERLYLNPSCGLEFLPREVAQAKLRRLVEGVQAARQALGIGES